MVRWHTRPFSYKSRLWQSCRKTNGILISNTLHLFCVTAVFRWTCVRCSPGFVIQLFRKRILVNKWHRLITVQMSFLSPNRVKALNETQSTDPNQWPGLIFTSSITGILKEGTLIPWNRLYNDSTNIIAYAMLYNGNEMVIPSSRLCLWCCRAQINKATKTPIRIAPVTTPSIMYSMLSSGFLCWYPGRPASSLSPLSSPATPSLSYEDSAIPRLALTLNDGDNVDAGGHWSVPFDNINTPTNQQVHLVFLRHWHAKVCMSMHQEP